MSFGFMLLSSLANIVQRVGGNSVKLVLISGQIMRLR